MPLQYNIQWFSGFDEAIDVEKQKSLLRKLVFQYLLKLLRWWRKGMRVVESEADFESQMDRAISEALLLWRRFCFIENMWVRHIEIQLADSHGNVLYLFERSAASSVVTKSDEEALLRF
jgi:propionyl-CoA carboxylase alpha chain